MNQSSLIRNFLLLVATVASPAFALADGYLSIDADAVTVSINPRASSARSFIRLPAVEFAFNIEADCDGNLRPGSLTLSIADTYASLSAGQLENEVLESMMLRVPAKQIAPVAIGDFCIVDEFNDQGTRQSDHMLVRDALSAQASLLCTSETGQNTTYVSQPLDIRLKCESPTEDQTGENQAGASTEL